MVLKQKQPMPAKNRAILGILIGDREGLTKGRSVRSEEGGL